MIYFFETFLQEEFINSYINTDTNFWPTHKGGGAQDPQVGRHSMFPTCDFSFALL